jgi:hypothetical protein
MLNKRIIKILLLCTAFLLMIACLAFARTDHKEYKNSKLADCKDCHSGAGDVSNHGGFKEHRQLAERAGTNCADCHQQSYCLDCHSGGNIETYKQKSLSGKGEAMPTTHRTDFISIHALKAKDDPQNCYRCHESNFCSDCHSKLQNKGSMSIKSHSASGNTQRYFLNSLSSSAEKAAHAADARRNLQSCQGCHPDAVVCSQCHNMNAPGGKVFKRR